MATNENTDYLIDDRNEDSSEQIPIVSSDELEEDLGSSQGYTTETDPDDDAIWQERKKRAISGINHSIKNIDDWMASAKKPETKEQREKRERRERSRRVIAGLSDGISALANMYYTTQYAPDMHDQNASHSKETDNRIERMRTEREKNEQAYINYALKRGDLEAQKADTEAKIDLARLRAANDGRKADAYIDLLGKKSEGQDEDNRKKKADADRAEVIAKNEPTNQKQKQDNEKKKGQVYDSTVKKNKAAASNSYASADEHKAGAQKKRSSIDTGKKSGKKSGGKSGGSDEVTITETYDKNGNLKSTKKVTKNNGKGTGTKSAKSQFSIH